MFNQNWRRDFGKGVRRHRWESVRSVSGRCFLPEDPGKRRSSFSVETGHSHVKVDFQDSATFSRLSCCFSTSTLKIWSTWEQTREFRISPRGRGATAAGIWIRGKSSFIPTVEACLSGTRMTVYSGLLNNGIIRPDHQRDKDRRM